MRNLFTKRLLLILFIFFVIISPGMISAYEVSNITFYDGNSVLETISYGHSFNVRISFSLLGIDPTNVTSIVLDLSDINTNPVKKVEYSNIILSSENCNVQDTVYNCILLNKELNINKGTVIFNVSITDNTGVILVSGTKTFSVSNANPTLQSIVSDYCDSERCYVKNGAERFAFTFSGSNAGFQKRMVYFGINGEKFQVNACEQSVCYGTGSINCVEGQNVDVYITSMRGISSQDDAGNSIQNTQPASMKCDNAAPELISEINIKTESGFDEVKTGDNILITANVSESNKLKATANFSSIGGSDANGVCQLIFGKYLCSWQTTITKQGPYTAVIPFTFEDSAGNRVTQSKTVDVLGVLSPNNQTGSFDYWRIGSAKYFPGVVNKENLKYIARTIYAEINLIKKNNNPYIVDIMPETCIALSNNTNSGDLRFKPNPVMNEVEGQTSYVLELELVNKEYSQYAIDFNCSLKILSKVGNYIMGGYETEYFPIHITFNTDKVPGEKIQEEIDKTIKDINKNKVFYDKIKGILNTMMPICKGLVGLKTISTTFEGARTATAPLEEVKVPIYLGVIPQTFGTIGHTADITSEVHVKSIYPICQFLSCQTPFQTLAVDKLREVTPGADTLASLGGYGNFSSFINPYNSIVMAYATVCLPAIVVNRQKSDAIKCQYVTCLSQSEGEGNLAACRDAKEYSECTYMVGQIWNTIPYTAILKDIANTVKSIVRDPVALFGTLGHAALCAPLRDIAYKERTTLAHLAAGACTVPETISGFLAAKQNLDALVKWDAGFGKDYCESALAAIDRDTYYYRGLPETKWGYSTEKIYKDPSDNKKDGFNCDTKLGCSFSDKKNYGGLSVKVIPRAEGSNTYGFQNNYDIAVYYEGKYVGTAKELEDAIITYQQATKTSDTVTIPQRDIQDKIKDPLQTLPDSQKTGQGILSTPGYTSVTDDVTLTEPNSDQTQQVGSTTAEAMKLDKALRTLAEAGGLRGDILHLQLDPEFLLKIRVLVVQSTRFRDDLKQEMGEDYAVFDQYMQAMELQNKLESERAGLEKRVSDTKKDYDLIKNYEKDSKRAEKIEKELRDNPYSKQKGVVDYARGNLDYAENQLNHIKERTPGNIILQWEMNPGCSDPECRAYHTSVNAVANAESDLITQEDKLNSFPKEDKAKFESLSGEKKNLDTRMSNAQNAANKLVDKDGRPIYPNGIDISKKENLEQVADKSKERYNEEKNELKRREKEVRQQNSWADLGNKLNDMYGKGIVKSWKTSISIGRNLVGLNNFITIARWEGLTKNVDYFFNRYVGWAINPEATACNIGGKKPEATALVRMGGTYLASAHIEASKFQNYDDKFEYFITATISNPKKDGLRFTIKLKGNGEELVRYPSPYLQSTGDYILPANASLSFSGQGTYYMVSEKEYSQVCIVFSHTMYSLKEYFDEVDGTEVCNEIKNEV